MFQKKKRVISFKHSVNIIVHIKRKTRLRGKEPLSRDLAQ